MANQMTPDEVRCATRCHELWIWAVIKYELPEDIKFVLRFESKLQVFYGAKNKEARRAVGKTHWDAEMKTATCVLNRDAIAQNAEDMLVDTVPHEVAHIVCMVDPRLGKGHDAGWIQVCKDLGGSGDHRYSYGDYDMRIRRRRRYLYDIPGIGPRRLSDVKHKDLQRGKAKYKDTITGLYVLKEHWTGQVE